MKKIISITVFLFLSTISFAQTNFNWSKTDSVQKTKAQIYSDTKMFIAETWKSSKDVIQNDDKDGGMILVKGISIQHSSFQLNDHIYTYAYSVKFLFKENRYKIIIENVHCESATCAGNKWPLVEPTDDTSQNVGGVPSKKLAIMMESLKSELNSIVIGYEKAIKTTSAKNGDW
jgi:hypothetical protein